LSEPVIEILSGEVLRDTSILWIKDVILEVLIWDWAVVKAAQRERAMYYLTQKYRRCRPEGEDLSTCVIGVNL